MGGGGDADGEEVRFPFSDRRYLVITFKPPSTEEAEDIPSEIDDIYLSFIPEPLPPFGTN